MVQAVEEVGLDSGHEEEAAPRKATTFTGLVPSTQPRDVRPGDRPYRYITRDGERHQVEVTILSFSSW